MENSLVEKTYELLKEVPLCDRCLGRQFAFLTTGTNNLERGRSLKWVLAAIGHQRALVDNPEGYRILRVLDEKGDSDVAAQSLQKLGKKFEKTVFSCKICQGRLGHIPQFAEKIWSMVGEIDFQSFLVGARVPTDVTETEDEMKASHHLTWGESIKSEISRELGKALALISGKIVDTRKPDLSIVADIFDGKFEIRINPSFIAGRYRKLVRGIPQAAWLCRRCRGKGCDECAGTGRMYPESVEELICKTILEFTGGSSAKLHASGREDIDARMLGNGRPFVVEVREPRRRAVDLNLLEKKINEAAEGKIEVLSLRRAERSEVRKVKSEERSKKVYRAIVVTSKKASDEDLTRLERAFSNVIVKQQTPTRVLHRRSDRVREKEIYEAKAKRLAPKKLELTLSCQGGLYVKELVDGDGGRTKPSLSEILGSEARCSELDVIEVGIEG